MLTIQQAAAASLKAYKEGRLQFQNIKPGHTIGPCYSQYDDEMQVGCAIGVALDPELAEQLIDADHITKLVTDGDVEVDPDSLTSLSCLQMLHDGVFNALYDNRSYADDALHTFLVFCRTHSR